ncbi:MAG: sigma-54-dependent Fis family transcriptional regulator [Gemmatimonadaceae bacterium]|nr:sigma-54-dependent Fis family transcriptional regulator [Gemmatimonadaceae bacterium]MDQ3517897.1 sigma-54 dependent transcriptional regulator [Gemmatimonadota bacterium]
MKILIVDDEPALRHTLSIILSDDGHTTASACNGEEALAALAPGGVDLVLCDLRMPRLGGLEFLERYTQREKRALVIMMSAYGDYDTAITAMQRGAYDFIPKPFKADEVRLVVQKAAERERLRARVQRLEGELSALAGGEIVGRSAVMRTAVELARKVAPHPSATLITGESGTGKELIARLIHDAGPRAKRPFVAINCGALPEALLESELFGHVKGAFTGAVVDKKGLFEEAHRGTLFLDELGELPLALQVKLLRALQEDEVRPLGATASRTVDVRVVAATNRDLAADVKSGRFRDDLYYRINVVTIALPPLRERREDIPDLASHFLARHNKRMSLDVQEIAAGAMRVLVGYAWPGNVRELENVIERALVLTTGSAIEPEHLPEALCATAPATVGFSVKKETATLERNLIQRALAATEGNRTRAAHLLELSHRALLYKIREYGLGQ